MLLPTSTEVLKEKFKDWRETFPEKYKKLKKYININKEYYKKGSLYHCKDALSITRFESCKKLFSFRDKEIVMEEFDVYGKFDPDIKKNTTFLALRSCAAIAYSPQQTYGSSYQGSFFCYYRILLLPSNIPTPVITNLFYDYHIDLNINHSFLTKI